MARINADFKRICLGARNELYPSTVAREWNRQNIVETIDTFRCIVFLKGSRPVLILLTVHFILSQILWANMPIPINSSLMPFLAFAAGIVLLLYFARRRAWYLAVWVPAFAVSCFIIFSLLDILPGHVSSGPEAGFVALESFLYVQTKIHLVVLSGITVLGALILWPRKQSWTIGGASVGLLFTLAGIWGWNQSRLDSVSVVVLDSNNNPVANQAVSFAEYKFGLDNPRGSVRSDSAGIAQIRLPKGALWSATTTTTDGTVCSVETRAQGVELDQHPKYRETVWKWHNRQWGWRTSFFGVLVPVEEQARLELRLRMENEVISPWVLSKMRQKIQDLRNGKTQELGLTKLSHPGEKSYAQRHIEDLLRRLKSSN